MENNLSSLNTLNTISNYNTLIYKDSVVPVWDIVTNKQLMVNTKLISEAINKMVKDKYSDLSINDFYEKYNIIYNKNYNFNNPINIIIKDKNSNKFTKIDLTPYWPLYIYISQGNEVIMEKDKVINDEVINIDYVRNEALMFNKESNIKYTIKLDKLNKDTNLSAYLNIDDTFTNLYYNR